MEIIIGNLLGDLALSKLSKTKKSRVSFSSKHEEYTEYLKEKLNELNLNAKTYDKYPKAKGKTYYQKGMYTSMSKALGEERQRWYPHGIKVIPKNLDLSPNIVLHWFLDDGQLIRTKYKECIRLWTSGFTVEEVEFLKELLNKEVGISSKIGYAKKGKRYNYIRVNKSDFKRFYDYIGESPVSCFEYKWF